LPRYALSSASLGGDYLVVRPWVLQPGRQYTFMATVNDGISLEATTATVRQPKNKYTKAISFCKPTLPKCGIVLLSLGLIDPMDLSVVGPSR
jgi:predicted component of type VI protein secretion system